MIQPITIVLILMAAATLVLNLYAMRADAEAAGHDRKQLLRMGAIWATIITALTLLFSGLQA